MIAPRTDKQAARRALDAPRLTLNEIAEVAGVSRASLNAYRDPNRPDVMMPEPIRLRLAQFLEAHAGELQEIAAELRNRPEETGTFPS
jgi:hypothetical protein